MQKEERKTGKLRTGSRVSDHSFEEECGCVTTVTTWIEDFFTSICHQPSDLIMYRIEGI